MNKYHPRIGIGYWVICTFPDQAPEPEGTVIFFTDPEPGEGTILCDGRIWQITREYDGKLYVKVPYVGYGAGY